MSPQVSTRELPPTRHVSRELQHELFRLLQSAREKYRQQRPDPFAAKHTICHSCHPCLPNKPELSATGASTGSCGWRLLLNIFADVSHIHGECCKRYCVAVGSGQMLGFFVTQCLGGVLSVPVGFVCTCQSSQSKRDRLAAGGLAKTDTGRCRWPLNRHARHEHVHLRQ